MIIQEGCDPKTRKPNLNGRAIVCSACDTIFTVDDMTPVDVYSAREKVYHVVCPVCEKKNAVVGRTTEEGVTLRIDTVTQHHRSNLKHHTDDQYFAHESLFKKRDERIDSLNGWIITAFAMLVISQILIGVLLYREFFL